MPKKIPSDLPVRYCHGCHDYDDHPRVTHVIDINNPALDKLYHYDCAPAQVVADPKLAPSLEATAAGTKGHELREVMAKHALTIEEDPADDQNGV